MRLDIPAGTAVRFEPGEEKPVQLVELGGAKRSFGLNALTNGPAVHGAMSEEVRQRLAAWKGAHCMSRMDRSSYAAMFGPTTGDAVRLGGYGAVGRNRARLYRLWRRVQIWRRQSHP